MTNYEAAQSTRNEAVCGFLVKNAEVFADDVALCAIAAKMQADSATVIKDGTAATKNNTGYSIDKTIAKKAASQLVADMSATCQVKLNLLRNKTISFALNDSVSFYFKASDALCASRLMAVYNVMDKNQVLITTDYVTAAQLATLLTKIKTFTKLCGKTSVVNSGAIVITKQFKVDMKATNANVKTIKTLGRKYEETNPLFFKGINAACKMPAITKLNTIVSINVIDAESKGVLAKVAGTLTKSKEKPESNVAGIMLFNNVLAGTATLSFTLKDYITKLLTINIKRGKLNKFNVSLTPGTMTPEEEATIKATLDRIIAQAIAKLTAKKKKRKDARTAAALLKK